jgi:predicted nuclease with TOPRIM domain
MDNKTMIKVINGMQDKIDALELWKSKLNDMDRILLNRIDDLEAKNYELRSELDGIYKVLEMDACDIQKLQDKIITIKELRKFKDWDEFNEAMGEAHKTLKRVTLNKIQIKNNKMESK